MHHNIAFDEKESRRWLAGAEMAAEHLAPVASQIIVVSDREGDIYSMFARRPEAVDLVVRAAQDRVLAEGGHLFSAAAAWPILGTAQVKVQPKRPGDKGGTAEVTVKAGAVTIKRPNRAVNRREPRTLTLGLVEVREAVAPKGAGKPLLWHLLTTLPLATLADAQEAVRLYRLRWRIEEVFRLMKSDGLDIEDSQLETAGRLLNLVHRSKRRLQPEFGKIDAKQKASVLAHEPCECVSALAALALVAAARTIQLVDARDGSARPATDVIASEQIDAAAAISTTLEGATPRQQNPHAKGSLGLAVMDRRQAWRLELLL